MEIKHIISGKNFHYLKGFAMGKKEKKKRSFPQPQFPWPSSEMQPTVAAPAPSLSATVIQWPVLKKPLRRSGELRRSSWGYSPNFFLTNHSIT